MQFKTTVVVASIAAVAVAQNASTNATNGTNATSSPSGGETGAASSQLVSAGVLGAVVAGGIALVL